MTMEAAMSAQRTNSGNSTGGFLKGGSGNKYARNALTELGSHAMASIKLAANGAKPFLLKAEDKTIVAQVNRTTVAAKMP